MRNKSWLWYLNFCFLQWICVRLEREIEAGLTTRWNIIVPIIPLTGWWQCYVPRLFIRIPVYTKH